MEDQVVDGRKGLECILGKLAEGCKGVSVGSGYGPVAGSCKYGDEPSSSGAVEFLVCLLFS
jgi:hypothetical protein